MIVPKDGKQTRDGFVCRLTDLKGASPPFPQERALLSGSPPYSGEACLLAVDGNEATRLCPLIRVIGDTTDFKVYFFSRTVGKSSYEFVSHHAPNSPSVAVSASEDQELAELITSLFSQKADPA